MDGGNEVKGRVVEKERRLVGRRKSSRPEQPVGVGDWEEGGRGGVISRVFPP